ncbi:hypothetical protein [Sphingomonas sp. PAMC 26617]|uniref:hypothetical protein n=1 Tax=Sphingomonas sp. PAMC 26617 TaxID=1112216 RepID=UPI0012F5177B|nr:hypothetical protein [Sphingomonas sp. PAMC 26617]
MPRQVTHRNAIPSGTSSSLRGFASLCGQIFLRKEDRAQSHKGTKTVLLTTGGACAYSGRRETCLDSRDARRTRVRCGLPQRCRASSLRGFASLRDQIFQRKEDHAQSHKGTKTVLSTTGGA